MGQAAFHGNVGTVRGLEFSHEGKPRFSFSVGEGHSRFDKQANAYKETGTTWRNVTVFGKRAEALAETIQQGAKQQVVVIGREETREYESKDGGKGSSFDVIADVVGIIPKAQQGGTSTPPAANTWNAPAEDPWASSSQGGDWGRTNPSGATPPF